MKTINAYNIRELSDQAQQKAYKCWIDRKTEFFYLEEARKTISAVQKYFDFTLRDWSFDSYSYSYELQLNTIDENFEDITDVRRVYAYIMNNYYAYLVNSKRFSKGSIYDKDSKKRTSRILKERECCPFTGMCYDEFFLDPLYAWLKKPYETSYKELMEECCDSLFKALQEECTYQESFEYFIEHAEANEYYFLEDGKMI